MSLCPSSSHQLVAAAIAFRRARRKFPKDFGLESAIEHTSGSTKANTVTSREGPINQARSSSTLVRRTCNSRSDHVCPASVRSHDYDNWYTAENSISCSCCRTRHNGEDISGLRNECSGDDAVDTVPSREHEEFVISGADKNEFVKPLERDRRSGVASRTTTNKEAAKSLEWLPQPARSTIRPSTFYHHREARCSSKQPCSDSVNLLYASRDSEETARGNSSGDRSEDLASASYHATSIDLDGNAEESVVGGETGRHDLGIEDARAKLDTSASRRKVAADSTRCKFHQCEESSPDLLTSVCDCRYDRCHHHHRHRDRCDRPRDCFHRHCCWLQRCDNSSNELPCETHGRVCDERTRHRNWRDESSRLYARQCSKTFDVSAAREHNDEERREDDDDDDDDVAVINHKDSMCILAEKYKAKRCRGKRCGDKARWSDSTGKDECDKSLTSEIIDQPEPLESANMVSHEEASMRHVCRAHCESCGITIAKYNCGCRLHATPEAKLDRLKSPLSETAAARCCSTRASCRHF